MGCKLYLNKVFTLNPPWFFSLSQLLTGKSRGWNRPQDWSQVGQTDAVSRNVMPVRSALGTQAVGIQLQNEHTVRNWESSQVNRKAIIYKQNHPYKNKNY